MLNHKKSIILCCLVIGWFGLLIGCGRSSVNAKAPAGASTMNASAEVKNRGGLQPGAPWPMFHDNVRHTGLSPYVGSQTGSLKWKFQTGGKIFGSSPVIGSDGTVYIGSGDDYLYALNPDGSLRWRFKTGDWISSSPVIGADGTVYVGSLDDYLYALNPDGSLKWKFKTGGWINYSSPAIGSDGTVYVGSDDQYLYALNPDGSLKWKLKTGDWHRISSSPAIGSDGTVYVGSEDGCLYAIK